VLPLLFPEPVVPRRTAPPAAEAIELLTNPAPIKNKISKKEIFLIIFLSFVLIVFIIENSNDALIIHSNR
jgi:hypothetical protein